MGFWMAPRNWWRGLPACLLLVVALPFGEQVQTFIGFPMRVTTAVLISDILALAGAEHLNVFTILLFENGVMQVDLPCSGVKSLWTGLLFLLAATCIERRPINLRWLMTVLVFVFLLFIHTNCVNHY